MHISQTAKDSLGIEIQVRDIKHCIVQISEYSIKVN